jgi:hypothetical protein
MTEYQSRELNQRSKTPSSEANKKPVKKKDKTSQSRETSSSLPEPQSAQELCDRLQEMTKKEEWDKSLAEHFIQLVVNPQRQYQLDDKQKQSLVKSILECPSKYRALVHLLILSKNFISQNGLCTLDDISTRIIDFVKDELELESRIEGTLLKVQGDEVLLDWLRKRLRAEKEGLPKKLDLIRNLISYLIGVGEIVAISSRLDIIIEAFSDSNYLQQYVKQAITLEKVARNRVKAVVDLFGLDKPTNTESERLVLFGSSAHSLVVCQVDEISQLRKNFENEIQTSHKKDERITGLESKCRELEDEITRIRSELKHRQDRLEQEEKLYEQLKFSSTAKINQQRNSALSQMKSRIEHDLQKLERCFNGEANSFAQNSQMGLEIINDIRNRLS